MAASAPRPFLTIFKPLPPLDGRHEPADLAQAVGSFAAQLDEDSELIVGLPRSDEAIWSRELEPWRRAFPRAAIRLCLHDTPRQHANPKVGWLELLGAEARGEVWLWSDADITAPPGLIAQLRRELHETTDTARAVTTPYCIRRADGLTGLLDAAYVNLEFLPGALLLGRLGPLTFSLGAGVVFRRSDLLQRVSWPELGDSLADDYVLGQRLAPVRLSGATVESRAIRGTLRDAARHLHRWQRTVRWCRPGSFAALLLVHPLLGWLAACAMAPRNPSTWFGLGVQLGIESLFFVLIMARVGLRLRPSLWIAIAAWPLARVASWLAAWLPLAVVWSDSAAPWSHPIRRRESAVDGNPRTPE